MEKVIVDKNTCISCGFCAASKEEVFEMGEDAAYTKEGKNIMDNMNEEEKNDIMDILEGCPVGAIKIEKSSE